MKVLFDKRKPGYKDPRKWIAWMEPREGKRMFLGRFFTDEKQRLTVEWIGPDDIGITQFDTPEAAFYFFEQAHKAGLLLIDIDLAPADDCAMHCGRCRVSPYQTPPKEPYICEFCRKSAQAPAIDKKAKKR